MRTRDLMRSLNKAKKDLTLFNKELPHNDTYVTVSCVSLDMVKALSLVSKEIKTFLKMAREDSRKKK